MLCLSLVDGRTMLLYSTVQDSKADRLLTINFGVYKPSSSIVSSISSFLNKRQNNPLQVNNSSIQGKLKSIPNKKS